MRPLNNEVIWPPYINKFTDIVRGMLGERRNKV